MRSFYVDGEILKARGWPEGRVIKKAMHVVKLLEKSNPDVRAILIRLEEVRMNPAAWQDDALMGKLAAAVMRHDNVYATMRRFHK